MSSKGSSALHSASDIVLELKKTKDVVFIRAINQRDMEGDKELNFKIEKVVIGEDEDGDEVSSAIIQETGPTPGNNKEVILNVILAQKD